METQTFFDVENAERVPLEAFSERAYLEYAMYVILDRALPYVGDGLKPVQRRIVYAMNELRLNAGAKFKKSARTVGDVLGKFHPHGDSACYEAMVLMAQPFAYRYPLIDGQGNWGAPDDPKSFAAMRYTEARLSRYAETLLAELEQGTVDWVPNFDGTLNEPALLPARLPNVLINGATGIAVGMATDIPPHNLKETVAACIELLDNPEAGVEALCAHLKGPDFPTGAEIITPHSEILDMYRTGTGSLRMRATFERENGDIVITELPHQVSGARVLEQIAAQMQAKKLPMVADLRDESDHEDPVRLVIVPRSGRVDVDALMAHLFATTDLERTCRVNMNIVGLDGLPKVKGLVALLGEWLTFRRQTVKRRLSHRLDIIQRRLHILEGLLIAYLNIDAVIAVIRSEDHPKPVLMARFGLTDTQAEAVLNLRLRRLAKLEEIRIRGEERSLSEERDRIQKILDSPARLKTLIRKELIADAETYGDPRRSPIVQRHSAQAMTEEDLNPVEPVTVVLSQKGWIRAAKGHEVDPAGLSYKVGDRLLASARGRSNQPAVLLDDTGRSYSLAVHALPSARGGGEPLTGRLSPPSGAGFVTVLMGPDDQLLVLASDAGYGFLCRLGDLQTSHRNGKSVLTLPDGAVPLSPLPVADPETERLAAVTSDGRMLVFPLLQLPTLVRGKGNKIVQIPAGRAADRVEVMAHMAVVPADAPLMVHAGKRFLTLKPAGLEPFAAERGRRGRMLPRGFRNVTRLTVALDPQTASEPT